MREHAKYWIRPFVVLLCAAAMLLGLAAVAPVRAWAATSVGNVTASDEEGNVLTFDCGENQVKVELCTPRTVRVQLSQSGANGYRPADPQYYMVQKNAWPKVERTIETQGDTVTVRTAAMEVRIKKSPFRIGMYDLNGNLLSKDTDGMGMYTDGDTVGVKREEGKLHAGGIFGFGSGDHGRRDSLNRYERDFNEFTMSHGRLIAPFFMSTVGYGTFLNTIETDTVFYKRGGGFQTKGYLDYFFMYGPDFKTILNEYAEITGRMELYGKWAHGFMLSKYGNDNATQAEFLQWLHRLRDEGYPTDCYVFDYGWRGDVADNGGNQTGAGEKWGKQMWSNDVTKFPDLEAMFREADALGFRVGLHNNAGTPEASGGDKLYLPEYEKKWVQSYMDSVITTGYGDWFWPDEFDVLGSNTAPTFSAKGAFEAWQAYTDASRPMFITRGSYGGQHFATAWSGDINNTSEELAYQIGYSIDAGLVGYWATSHDLGGFMKRPSDELYTRWVSEFGAWNGIMRAHGHDGREPWTFGKTAQDTLKSNLKTRYALYPYIYTMAWQGYSQGVPMMRAMLLEDGSRWNPDAWTLNKQYYFGDWFLVAPASDTSDTVVSVWLPPQTTWYDYKTGLRYEGGASGKTIRVAAALEDIPVFVKAGAIVPMGPDVNYADEKPLDPLTLDIYPRGTTTYTLFEDDGESRRYITENAYTTTDYTCVQDGANVSFVIGARNNRNAAAFTPQDRSYVLKFNHMSAVRGVTLDKIALNKADTLAAFNAAASGYFVDGVTLYVKMPDTGKEMTIAIDSDGVVEPELGQENQGVPPQRIGDSDVYEVENALPGSESTVAAVATGWKGYTGSGYAGGTGTVGGWKNAGDTLDCKLNIVRAGTYDLSLRLNCGKKSLNDTATRRVGLYFDGDKKGEISFKPSDTWGSNDSGAWRMFDLKNVALAAGLQTLSIRAETAGNFHLDSVAFVRHDTSQDAFAPVTADKATVLNGVTLVSEGDDNYLHATADKQWAQFDELKGDNRGGLVARVSSTTGGSIIVYENGVGDKILATVALPTDGAWHELAVFSKNTDVATSNIFFEFNAPESGSLDAKLSWFEFVRKVDAFAPIAAVSADERNNINVRDNALVNIYNGSWARFADLDFGEDGAATVQLTAGVGKAGGTAEIYIDSIAAGNKIADIAITNTGSWSTRRAFLAACRRVTGVHGVFVRFTASGGDAICDFTELKFSRNAVSILTEVIGGTATVQTGDVTATAGTTVGFQIVGIASGFEVQSVTAVDAAGNAVAIETLSAGVRYSLVVPQNAPVKITVTLKEKLPLVGGSAVLELEEGTGRTNDAGTAVRVDKEWFGYTGSGYTAGWKTVGDYVEMRVEVEKSGLYALTLRGAAGKKNDPRYDNSPRTGALYIDGVRAADFGLTVQNGWGDWIDYAFDNLRLSAGKHTIKLTAEGAVNPGNFNLDNLTVTRLTDETQLIETVAAAKALRQDDYQSGWGEFTAALEAAETLLKNTAATQAQIDAAYETLAEKQRALVPVETDPDPDDGANDGTPDENTQKGCGCGGAVGTASALPGLTLLCAAVAALARKRRTM